MTFRASHAVRRAERYQARGLPLPVDLVVALLAEGIDPSAFDS